MQHAGRICIQSDGNIEPLILQPSFHEKELKLFGSSDGWDYQEHAKWFFNLMQEYPFNLERLFDYQTTTTNLITTFKELANGKIRPIQILVKYNNLHVDELPAAQI